MTSQSNYEISDQFLEMLNSVSATKLNKELFFFTAPQASGTDGKTIIQITCHDSTGLYGRPRISYKRFNVSNVATIKIPYTGQATLHDLISQVSHKRLFKYFVWDEDRKTIQSRFLKARTRDFENKEIPALTESVLLPIKALSDSEQFYGELKIFLQL